MDIGKAVKDAADTVVDVAGTAAKTVKEEMDKAWDALSADDPEGCPVGEENEPETKTSGEESKEETVENLTNQQIEALSVRIKWELDWLKRVASSINTK